MKNKKKITSNPKLFYSAPILSLHCTLMSKSIPGVGLGEAPCVAAVRTLGRAAPLSPPLRPSVALRGCQQDQSLSLAPCQLLVSQQIAARPLRQGLCFSTKGTQTSSEWEMDLELTSSLLRLHHLHPATSVEAWLQKWHLRGLLPNMR